MHSVASLATLQTPLATFFPFKKVPKPYFVSKNRRYCCVSTRSCCPSAHTLLSHLCVTHYRASIMGKLRRKAKSPASGSTYMGIALPREGAR